MGNRSYRRVMQGIILLTLVPAALACSSVKAAIGTVDESGVAKSGKETVGVGRQWNGNRGKVENCVVGVHLGYASPGFQCLLDSRLYLPEDWANDPERRKKTTFPMRSRFGPNRRSRWRKSNMLWTTAFVWRPGRSTSCMAATASFSMA